MEHVDTVGDDSSGSPLAALVQLRERLDQLIADVAAGLVVASEAEGMIARTRDGWRLDVEMHFESTRRRRH